MPRGTVAGETPVSQAATEEYRAGHDRTFGERQPNQRGRWIWDEQAQKLVRAEDYVPPAAKSGTGIMVDRFMEGAVAPDGTDIGSRQKRAAWMKANGVADYDDYKGAREKRQKEMAARAEERRTGKYRPDKELRNIIGRELYKQKVIL